MKSMKLSFSILRKIQNITDAVYTKLVSIRRDLHRHPELSGEEAWTAAYLADKLRALGLNVHTSVYNHGLVADLVVDPARPTVALRVDMDALPIQEENDVPYCSQVPGVMHACGHDVHSAIGVGVAAVLKQLAPDLPGNVRFIFQPEEEEITGALGMIDAGALSDPTPQAIFGLHVAPLPAGQVAWTEDLFLAGFDHYLAALFPDKGIDLSLEDLDAVALCCCGEILKLNKWHLPITWDAMQDMWQVMQAGPKDLRRFIVYDASVDDEEDSPWRGQFGVGITAAAPRLRRAALGQVRSALRKVCRDNRTSAAIELMGSMPDMRNNPDLVRSVLPALQAAVGVENSVQLKAAFPFNCEDFAFYTKLVPSAMFWLGGADPGSRRYAMLHTPDFDVDERCLITGTAAMAALLLEFLTSHPS
jgi:metal-dependent amidase/aminoacylase/carboxypeptidase family protein